MKFLRFLLLPFSWLYGLIVGARNAIYDRAIFKSFSFDLPIISVGNLSVGGTGKTPMIEYLIRLLKDEYQIATLSRGYRRRSRGFVLANEKTTAADLGDEPMQFKYKYPEIMVTVGENRALAVTEILFEKEDTEAILLDDAFQHRALKPQFQILLTAFNSLFVNDDYLPYGSLRDSKSAYLRADVIVVSKCPASINVKTKNEIIQQINPAEQQRIFFSGIRYLVAYHLFDTDEVLELGKDMSVLLLSGIARNEDLNEYVRSQVGHVECQSYGDHHYFKERDLIDIQAAYNNMSESKKVIITTEKDAMRLLLHRSVLMEMGLPIYVLPIEMFFIESNDSVVSAHSKPSFDDLILKVAQTPID